jgi:hypothetical protein
MKGPLRERGGQGCVLERSEGPILEQSEGMTLGSFRMDVDCIMRMEKGLGVKGGRSGRTVKRIVGLLTQERYV